MECSSPPPLNDDQLSAALDNAAEPEVLAHLGRCPSCAVRLADARRAEQGLRANLYRWDCPSPQALADYHLGRVAPDEDRAIRRHLAECTRCSAEIEQLRLFLQDEAPAPQATPAPPRPAPRRGWWVARPLYQAGALAVRGSAGAGPLMFESDAGATIFLDVQPDAAGQVALQGQLVAEDQAQWAAALVEARQAGALVATATIDDLGAFYCAALPVLPTELRIARPDGHVLVMPEFDLTA